MVHASIIALAAALFGSTVVSAVGPWGQCGGQGWTGGTTCDAGWVCTFSNPYYSQCLQGTGPVTTASTSTTTSKGVTTTSKAPSGPSTTTKPISTTATTTSPSGPGSTTSSSPPPASSDNPFIGVTPFLSPFYGAEIDAAVANITAKGNSALAARAAKVKAVPNFTWIDVAAKVPTIGTYLASALALQQSSGVKQVVQIVIYDLPDRDCAALASNGEYSIANGGAAHYQAYIDGIAAQISAYPDVRVIAVYEPDSLANLVTNLNVAKCSGAQSTYLALAKYAINKLTQPNLSLYLDAGHAGWLGWPANIGPAAQLFGQLLAGTNKPNRVRGLATNVANYNAYQAASPDPITQGNSNYDEIHYINALAPLLTSNGFPAHFIVDTSRSGVQNIRSQWGDWCNVLGAGFGLRPTTNTGSAFVDALTWVKPGGECDGTSDQSSPRYDAHCGQADATKPAPEAGSWFELQFETLLTAANPAF